MVEIIAGIIVIVIALIGAKAAANKAAANKAAANKAAADKAAADKAAAEKTAAEKTAAEKTAAAVAAAEELLVEIQHVTDRAKDIGWGGGGQEQQELHELVDELTAAKAAYAATPEADESILLQAEGRLQWIKCEFFPSNYWPKSDFDR